MAKKAPRRTAERILETTLALFNRFGEPNVSTTLISNELNISPGNLYYHFPAKDELVNALFNRYEEKLYALLAAAPDIEHVEDAWFFIHALFELVWEYRFLYRDLNDLLSKNRRLEDHVKDALLHKTSAFRSLLDGLQHSGALQMTAEERDVTATHMVVMLTWWLSYRYVLNPRQALEPENAALAMTQGVQHALLLITPFLLKDQKIHLKEVISNYR
jgi:AcrR family transcriptional regulator